MWRVEFKRVLVFVLDDCVVQIANRLEDDTPFIRAWGSSEGWSERHYG